RDPLVTGVQTCALPIFEPRRNPRRPNAGSCGLSSLGCRLAVLVEKPRTPEVHIHSERFMQKCSLVSHAKRSVNSLKDRRHGMAKIGRASCRERAGHKGG